MTALILKSGRFATFMMILLLHTLLIIFDACMTSKGDISASKSYVPKMMISLAWPKYKCMSSHTQVTRMNRKCMAFLILPFNYSEAAHRYLDCNDVYKQGFTAPGVYEIDWSRDGLGRSKVYCKDRWTYLLVRGQYGNPEDHFMAKTWEEHEAGFGQANNEYWIGLSAMYSLTNVQDYEMKVELTDNDDIMVRAHYDSVKLLDRTYRLELGGFSSDPR